MPPRNRVWREEKGYRASADAIDTDVLRVDELSAAAIAWIERDAESCSAVDDEPLIAGHGPMQVSQASTQPDMPELQVFFTIRDDCDCSLWRVRTVPEEE